MHMVFSLMTVGPQGEAYKEVGGSSRFIADQCPTDFTGAKMTISARGELLTRGAQFVLLIQGNVEGIISGWLCSGQPFQVNEDWTRQTITLSPDPGAGPRWACATTGRTCTASSRSIASCPT